jgi:hypothetical protein
VLALVMLGCYRPVEPLAIDASGPPAPDAPEAGGSDGHPTDAAPQPNPACTTPFMPTGMQVTPGRELTLADERTGSGQAPFGILLNLGARMDALSPLNATIGTMLTGIPDGPVAAVAVDRSGGQLWFSEVGSNSQQVWTTSTGSTPTAWGPPGQIAMPMGISGLGEPSDPTSAGVLAFGSLGGSGFQELVETAGGWQARGSATFPAKGTVGIFDRASLTTDGLELVYDYDNFAGSAGVFFAVRGSLGSAFQLALDPQHQLLAGSDTFPVLAHDCSALWAVNNDEIVEYLH